MPYKSEKIIKLVGTANDRQRKLTDEQKDEIISLKGCLSQRECARQYEVSRRLIQFLWDPTKLERNKQTRQNKNYYDKIKHREYMKVYRHHKQSLYINETAL